MSESQRVRVFSNGDAYLNWLHNNCNRCVKRPDCPLEEALSSACVLDGTISPTIARRLGVPADGSERWWCNERQTEAAVPTPAAHEVRKAGASMLPGMDQVPEWPADRKPSWTA
jgi:hypothetical protein